MILRGLTALCCIAFKGKLLQEMDTLAVWANPRGAVAHAPRVFRKAGRTDSKTAEAGVAERCFLLTAVTDAVGAASSTAFAAGICPAHS
jgi:hypothetical protein